MFHQVSDHCVAVLQHEGCPSLEFDRERFHVNDGPASSSCNHRSGQIKGRLLLPVVWSLQDPYLPLTRHAEAR